MHGQGFFFQAFVYLAAAVIAVPLAKRLGLGSVLGYLIAGMVIGPFGFGLIGEEGQDVMHFAEFGVVMMLFLIGLELQPALLWRMRGPILGMGGLQVTLSAAIIATIAAISDAQTITCSPPMPRIGPLRRQRSEGWSSRPMRKSIITTPNSAKCMTSWPSSPISPNPNGPMTMPAIR